jgi:sigma-B regulation protein RsbU (phosphoserine phosphatase)
MPHRILVVDDEPDLELLITQRFRKRIRANEISFLFAANGEEALAALGSESDVDVLLTDINMPVMDGLTLLSRIRDAHPMLRSVIVSAYGDMPNIRTALNRGAFDFITKPIDFQDLEITLDKAIHEVTMRKRAAIDKARLSTIDRELDVARRIQESLVPREFPRNARFEIQGAMIPATHVGGDLFDFVLLDSGKLAFVIGDVSGKGIAAALYMAVSRTLLRVAAGKGMPPRECMEEVNRFLRAERASSMFVTCFYGILDLETGELDYSRAGHNPPYLIRAAGSVDILDAAPGLPLGAIGSPRYTTAQAQLQPGDAILLFTDGVTEAMNPDGAFYGEERLVQILREKGSIAVEEMVSAVTADVTRFADGAPASDDVTVLGIRYKARE